MTHRPEIGRAHPRAQWRQALVVPLLALVGAGLAVVFSACGLAWRDDGAATVDQSRVGRSSFGLPSIEAGPADLAFTDDDAVTPANAPTGTPYRRCTIDYRAIDWSGWPDKIVDAHAKVSSAPCAHQTWYRDTAFQNGILSFMVLVGEDTLLAAAPAAGDPETVSDSLRTQGFDDLATMEIASSGPCEEGEVQVAVLTLRGPDPRTDGLEAMTEAAATAGATVDRGERVTKISGGGAPCVTAIIHDGPLLGWLSAPDELVLAQAIEGLTLRS